MKRTAQDNDDTPGQQARQRREYGRASEIACTTLDAYFTSGRRRSSDRL